MKRPAPSSLRSLSYFVTPALVVGVTACSALTADRAAPPSSVAHREPQPVSTPRAVMDMGEEKADAPAQAPARDRGPADLEAQVAGKKAPPRGAAVTTDKATARPEPANSGAEMKRKAQAKPPAPGPGYMQSVATTEALADPTGGDFDGRADAHVQAAMLTVEDRFSTFAIDVDTAAYSIARRTLMADRMPTASLVRVEEVLNYFQYEYEAPKGDGELFSIQADGARSPVDGSKHIFRVGIQAKKVSEADRLPANLVFLVDTSCSMTSADKLDLAKRSLELAVDRLGEQDKVAITTYAGSVRLVLPPTPASQKRKIKQAIQNLTSGGGTAMASGLELAYRQAASMLGDNSVTRIIVCSDGDANIGAASPQQILQSIEGYVKEGVTLSTIGFGDGNYKDVMMEQLANKGNGNYFYIDSMRQAERVFGRDLFKMLQDVAQDVKIQVEFNSEAVHSYRLVGYENRDVADRDFRNDAVDAGEIGAGHQVTALYELTLSPNASGSLGTVRVRAKKPRGQRAKEAELSVPVAMVQRPFERAPADLRFGTAAMGGAELMRQSPYASGWTYARVISIVSDTEPFADPDRAEFVSLMKKAQWLSGEARAVGQR